MIRHGESDGNATHLCQGYTNGFLTSKGIEQCKKLRENLKNLINNIDDIYCSDLNRVRQTCQIVLESSKFSFNNDVRINQLLREKNAGIYEMKPKQLMINDREKFKGDKRCYRPKNGESFNDLQLRVINFITTILQQQDYTNKKILIFTSGGFIMEYINYFILNENTYPNKASNCSIYIFKQINDKMEMIVENKKSL